MIKLKRGIFESISSAFAGPVKFLISYTSGKFHASNNDGAVYNEINPLVFSTSNINAIDYGADLSTLSVIDSGTFTWTTRVLSPAFADATTPLVKDIAYGNGIWAAITWSVDDLRRSTNGISWTTQNPQHAGLGGNRQINHIAFANNTWLILGNNGIRTSTDAITWTTRFTPQTPSSTDTNYIYPIFANGIWVVNTIQVLKTSTDAITWTTRTTSFSNTGSSPAPIAYGNGIFVAFVDQSGSFHSSTDGISWSTRSNGPGVVSGVKTIAYGNGIWAAGSYVGQIGTTVIRYFTSTDAITWTTRTAPMNNGSNSAGPKRIKFTNNLWTVTGEFPGNPGYYISTDAISWTTISTVNTENLRVYALEYGNSQWMLGSNNTGTRAYANTSPASINFSYANNAFIAAGNDGRIAKSTDGITWSTITSPTSSKISEISWVSVPGAENIYFIGGI